MTADIASGRWRADLMAGAVVAVLLIPQSLAYAMLAGLPAQVGLYASLLPLLAYAAWGSSPVLGLGPVAVLALMIAQALAGLPAGVSPEAGALVLAAEVGLLLALAALLRLDALAETLEKETGDAPGSDIRPDHDSDADPARLPRPRL